MRCLQCGKDVPLLKRLAGSEFCSDAHRREYQREYSQLALGRLLQAKPAQPEKNAETNDPVTLPTPPTPATTANGHSVPAPAPVTVSLSSAMPTEEIPGPIVTGPKTMPARTPTVTNKVEPKQAIPMPPDPAAEPAKKVAAEPAVATAARIQKPAPAAPRMAVVVSAEFEPTMSPTPDRPRRLASMVPAALMQASTVQWERGVEMADAAMHPIEQTLELRDSVRLSPRIDLGLSIVGPDSLEAQSQALAIPLMPNIAPEEPALWTADQRSFTGSVISLGSFANFQFSTTGFEEPWLAGPANLGETGGSVPSSALPELRAEGTDTEIATAAPEIESNSLAGDRGSEPPAADAEPRAEAAPQQIEGLIPDPVFEALPVVVQGIAAARAKPAQVFGAAAFSGGTVQVPQPSGLPLRPVMVLGPAEVIAEPVNRKKRKAGVRILPPEPIKPSLAAAKTPAAAFPEPNLVLPELRLQSPQNSGASRMLKIVGAVAGVAIIGLGLFFFLGNGSESGSKPAVETSASSASWITNFATDSKRERKISVLRSSMGLPNYRLDFEGSIQIKGLGWVYRAQDSKNYYVSKIELEKPGQNPAFVIAHYAVIDGVEQPRVEAPLHVGVPLGGHYRIRFSAAGDRFTTWVQDQQVDQWTDARLKSGGAGLYREGAEQFTLHGNFQVTPLIQEK